MAIPGSGRYVLLIHLSYFTYHSLIHIFEGELIGMIASGYHSEVYPNTPGRIVPGTRGLPNQLGLYDGLVTVNGVLKAGNGGYSTFFPTWMSAQDVIDTINEAYDVRYHLYGNRYEGFAISGIKIQMCLDPADKIITAYPVR